MPVLSMNRLSQLEQLEVVVATQDLLLSESVDISKYLEDEGKKTRRFEKPVTDEQIRRRERNTAWAVNVYRAWAERRNSQIGTVGDKYSSVPLDFVTTSVKEINYW